jgi:hypothetical protein
MVFWVCMRNPGSADYARSHRFGSLLWLSIRLSMSLLVGWENHLAPALETAGVTNVTGFQWTR